jgi:hypothetical protein
LGLSIEGRAGVAALTGTRLARHARLARRAGLSPSSPTVAVGLLRTVEQA